LQTPRERVLRCLEFDRPDRVPRDLWTLPVAWAEHGTRAMDELLGAWPIDFDRPSVTNPSFEALLDGDPYAPGRYRDEWGCVFENLQPGIIGEVKQPILDDWSKLADLRPPREALAFGDDEVRRSCAASDRFLFACCCPRPFERLQFLRGSEQLYIDLAERPGELDELLAIVHGLYCDEFDRWASLPVDALMFMDDWGSQRSLLIDPALWREVFKPLYAEYVRIAHDGGKKAFMHSDGWILDIYEDLIEIGLDAINSQLFCMDIEEIGSRFAGRITFWGEIDRQAILPRATPEECRGAVRGVVDSLHRPEGGVIAQFELGPGARIENAHAIFRAWEALT
jgi:uroporphyrinogen decarboxylase